MTPTPEAGKPLSEEELDALEKLLEDWRGPAPFADPGPRFGDLMQQLPRLLTTARSANLAYARGRGEGLEAAAKWHEDRADRVERESPGLGNFLSDTDRDYIAKRAAADREDAKSIRALKDAPQGET